VSPPLVPATGPYLDQILLESFPIWGDGLGFDQYGRHWRAQLRTAWGATHLDRVALVEHGAVTSSAKRYDLSAWIDGRIRRVLGIGAVFTSPPRRGQGGARRRMEAVLDTAASDGYEYAMLFSEIDPAFYERLDFVPMALVESRIAVRKRRGTPAVLVRAGERRDIPLLVEMSGTRAAAARLRLDRSEDWIAFGLTKRRLLAGLGPPGLRQFEFLVAEEGLRAAAYLMATVDEGRWFIEEAGDRDPSGARVGAILESMLARTPDLEPPEISAWLPHGFLPPQLEIVDTPSTSGVLMIRPLKDRTLPLPPLRAEEVVYWRSDYF
jgi:GNAT superfamily N-acetyltransferase